MAAAQAARTGPPARIVSLTPTVTETLFALGVGERVVGVSDESEEPPACRDLPRVGTFLAPVVERVLSLEPDLVITSPSPGNRSAVAALERAGIAVVVVAEGSGSIADARASLLETGVAVGRAAEAATLVAAVDAALEDVKRRVAGRARRLTAVVIGREPLVLAGRDSYLGELVVTGGGSNVADAVAGRWPRIGWEFLVSAAPDVMIDLAMSGDGADSAPRRGDLADSSILRARRAYIPSHDLLLRPGPRIGEAAVAVAKAIHPEAWEAAR